MATLDLALIQEILADATTAVAQLHGTVVNDTTLGNKLPEAKLNRALLNLSDQLLLASALVKNEYWTGKGLLSYGI